MARKVHFVTFCVIFGALVLFQGNSVIGKSSSALSSFGQEEFQNEDKITHQKRRYWIDELSDCIDMYCKKYINSDLYVKCMLANCPDGILITSEKRSGEDYLDDLSQVRGFKSVDLESSSEVPGSANSGDPDILNKDFFSDQSMFLLDRINNQRNKFD